MTWTEPRAVPGLAEKNPLATALGISLAVHLALFGSWRLGKQLGWWDHQPTWLLKLHKKKPLALVKIQKALQTRQPEIPLTFVEVDPITAAAEAPKDAKYYGAQNSKAANPDTTIESIAPKVDGQQTKVVRLENVPKPGPQPLQPAAPPEAAKPDAQAEAKPKGGESLGDLAKLKPDQIQRPNDGLAEIGSGTAPTVPREKPRTLAAARMHQMLAGEKMNQDGGVKRHGKVSLNVKATPFGAYDAALIAAVQQRWYDLLDNTHFPQRSGKVVLEFRLTYDGRITDMNMTENDVGELLGLLCERAVLDPAPFGRWPDDMRRMVGQNFREVTFTFYYN